MSFFPRSKDLVNLVNSLISLLSFHSLLLNMYSEVGYIRGSPREQLRYCTEQGLWWRTRAWRKKCNSASGLVKAAHFLAENVSSPAHHLCGRQYQMQKLDIKLYRDTVGLRSTLNDIKVWCSNVHVSANQDSLFMFRRDPLTWSRVQSICWFSVSVTRCRSTFTLQWPWAKQAIITRIESDTIDITPTAHSEISIICVPKTGFVSKLLRCLLFVVAQRRT